MKESIKKVMKYIGQIEKELMELIYADKELTKSYTLLLSIIGVGFVNGSIHYYSHQ